MEGGKKRTVIGVLVSGIMDDFSKVICRGVQQMAKQLDVDIVIFPGKYLHRDLSDNAELMYEYQFNTIFSYAGWENLDALIVAAGSIGCFTTKEKMNEMLRKLGNIPCVLVAYKLEGFTSVVFDNDTGIREGLTYLIDKIGCRKFGMIGGSLDNMDAAERKKAFVGVLNEHGIEVTDNMYVSGSLSRKGTDAFRELLDKNPDIEAVFCVNDDTAIGLYEEIYRRGMRPGRDICVLGYDDTILATKMNPSLSSIRANGEEMGEEALKAVIRLLHGEKVETIVMPTKFVKRDSIADKQSEEENLKDKIQEIGNADAYFNDIFYRFNHEKNHTKLNEIRDCFHKLLRMLVQVYSEGDDSPENFMEIQAALNDFLNNGALEYADTNNLLKCLETIYRTLRSAQSSRDEKFRLQETFSAIYRRIIRATDYQLGKILEEQEKENYSMKLFVRDVLSFEKGNDLSYGFMLANLEWLGIRNAYIYTFKEPVMHLYREEFTPPGHLYLKAVLTEGVVSAVPALKQQTPLRDIFRIGGLNGRERSSFVCMPLFSGEMLYGILLCDLTEGIFLNGEFLINQISSAAKMINLLQSNEKIQQELEMSLAVLKENNIALDNLSKSDGLTGILNRRGFYTEAERMLSESRKKERNLLVIYVDMNNLKIINDRYGHEEGDFSIKLISSILSEEMEKCGIAGRIGGDEFACLMEYSMADDGEEVLAGLYRRFEDFNRSSDKPYNITVSAGAFLMTVKEKMTIQEALTQADEKLYEVKKYRKKDVAKE